MIVDGVVVVVEVVMLVVVGVSVVVLDVGESSSASGRSSKRSVTDPVDQGEEGLFMRIIPVSSSDAGPDAIDAEVTDEVKRLACW